MIHNELINELTNLGQRVSHFAGLRNAKCETFRKANQKKSSKSHEFRHFWAKIAGKFAPAGNSDHV